MPTFWPVNGREYATLSPRVIIPANTASVQIDVTPLLSSPIKDRPVDALLALVEDKTQFYIGTNAQASATIMDAYYGTIKTFDAFAETYFPGEELSTVETNDVDGDGITAIYEYLAGTDPTVSDYNADDQLTILINNEGEVEVHIVTDSGLSDLLISLEVTEDLVGGFEAGEDLFELRFEHLTGNRIRRIYTSLLNGENITSQYFVQLNLSTLP